MEQLEHVAEHGDMNVMTDMENRQTVILLQIRQILKDLSKHNRCVQQR